MNLVTTIGNSVKSMDLISQTLYGKNSFKIKFGINEQY